MSIFPSDFSAVTENNRPIGVFDSGVGGLTVAAALREVLPAENIFYIGDTARVPYGGKSALTIERYSLEISGMLLAEGAKMIVVACNTASAAAFEDLSRELPVPVVSVVEPGARALAVATKVRRVGAIGTVATISSGAYQRALADVDANLEFVATACPGFVEFVERGQTTGDEVMLLAERLLAPIVAADIDALLLGCTHYPYLSRVISEVMGPKVVLVSSADETAFALADMLRTQDLLAPSGGTGMHTFLSSGDVEWFADFGRRLLGPELSSASRWERSTNG
ncbi:MAG: glutamate racemase [Actinomycetes bacterium]